MTNPILLLVGFLATGLALLGAVLPGLPTVPFLLVALWAFARSSDRMTRRLEQIPILKSALAEAHRFERRRSVRLRVKLTAMAFAWTSVVVTGLSVVSLASPVFLTVVAAALLATVFMTTIPTDRDPDPM